jgi:hypothetical protein
MAKNGMAYPRRFFICNIGATRKLSMTRLTVTLADQEKIALRTLAEKEFRDPRAQAALIIRQELERLGLLQGKPNAAQTGDAQLGGQDDAG